MNWISCFERRKQWDWRRNSLCILLYCVWLNELAALKQTWTGTFPVKESIAAWQSTYSFTVRKDSTNKNYPSLLSRKVSRLHSFTSTPRAHRFRSSPVRSSGWSPFPMDSFTVNKLRLNSTNKIHSPSLNHLSLFFRALNSGFTIQTRRVNKVVFFLLHSWTR